MGDVMIRFQIGMFYLSIFVGLLTLAALAFVAGAVFYDLLYSIFGP